MVHRLPPATLVDRFEYLRERCRGLRVVHVGFVDAGCQELNLQSGAWLHEHLATAAGELIGLDLDQAGVERARAARLRGARGRLPRRRRGACPRAPPGRRRGRRRGHRAPRRPRFVPRRPARAPRRRRRADRHHAERHRLGEHRGLLGERRGQPPRPRGVVHVPRRSTRCSPAIGGSRSSTRSTSRR